MQLNIKRKPSILDVTFGQLFIDGAFECYTLEDRIREVEGEPVDLWKIKGATAIPSGLYRVAVIYSPHFGPDTIAILHVPGFVDIRIHSGAKAEDTEGCPLVGDAIDQINMTLSGGISHGVKKRLNAKIKAAIDAGEEVWIQIDNPA
jgi:hypothetical protein